MKYMIYENLVAHANNEHQIPIYSYEEWNEFCAEYAIEGETRPGKTKIMPELLRFIDERKPALPIKRPTHEEMAKAFYGLKKTNYTNHVITRFDPESVQNKFKEVVPVEFLISSGANFNDVSNRFQCENRYSCGWHNYPSTQELWASPFQKTTVTLAAVLSFLWRDFDGFEADRDVTKWRNAFGLSGGYVAAQFKPAVAQTVYDYYRAEKVIDMSCGWGDRLAGFYTSNLTKEYLGCDPNIASYELYKKQCRAYEELLSSPLVPNEVSFQDNGDHFEIRGEKRVRIYNLPAEDMDWQGVVEQPHDLMFSSPPYFKTEIYALGQPGEDKQSWKRYSAYEGWRDKFLFKVIDDFQEVVTGPIAINIVDPVTNSKRHFLEQDMEERYGIKNILGMRINRRPTGVKGDQQNVLDDGSQLKFIEPVYIL
tara:strand:+ start:2616 stop:3887 length:1272 start_codon:yes stop_codon:yes gene_type:complete